ncbi:MAG: alpha-amylase family protein [Gemmatimonadaceae bacterium]|nr:alpha-amylase family protein [Gemmatimonadaceae bacterium]
MTRYHRSAAAAAMLLLAACGGGSETTAVIPPVVQPPTVQPPVLGQTYRSTGRAAAGDVFVHLFEWRWTDIARECEAVLGPLGYKGVQISPPSEHAIIRNASNFFPWWQRYQTVSYKLDQSRSGTAAELTDMVTRCKAVGVDIYADVVINHMTAGSGTGSAGSVYTKYSYPAVPFTQLDFNTPCGIDSYAVASQVQNCELVGLSDLQTASETVRAKIADYLIALHALGIAGYRIDAAKHVPAADLEAILTRVNTAAAAAGRPRPYVFLEIIYGTGDAVTPQQYYGVGFASGGATDITDFTYGNRISDAFLGRNSFTLSGVLQAFDTELLPSDKSVVFIDNHDTQRGGALFYADSTYELAAIMMLAHSQGYVSLMSSFGFDRSGQLTRDAGPASDGNGNTIPIYNPDGSSRCTTALGAAQVTSWICEHRRPAIANMVAFRKAAAGTPTTLCGRTSVRIDGDPNRVAFCRDGAGFLAMSLSPTAGTSTLPTRLPAGRYCNVAQHAFTSATGASPATCTGAPVVVASDGSASISLTRRSAVALHTRARLD